MRIFRNKTFSRYARKEGITDDELRALVPLLEANAPDYSLGGEVYKIRVPRPGEGKRGGYRVFVYFRNGERTSFSHGLAKSDLANISDRELANLKASAKTFLSSTENELAKLVKNGDLIEITEEQHEKVSK
ncbi:addiction module toxin RelE [Spirochaetia bacterium]|nr:addiction module toxin RelE [Spirochaetia bacterium]